MTPRFKPEQKFRPEQRLTWKVTATLIGVVDREPEWNDHLGCYIYDLRYLAIQDETNPLKMRSGTLVSHLEPNLTLLKPKTR
jgi:hypothetical protein